MLVLQLLASVSLLLSLTAGAQTAPDFDLNVPSGHLRVPVVVTGKQGKPISGLHADDFKVFDSGRPAAIEAFLPLFAAPHSAAHFTVFYLDDRHLDAEQMIRARKAIDTALAPALDSNGYVAIVTGTGSTNSGFSQNPDQLRKSLASIQTTAFAAVGTSAHNFDLTGTYASLADYAAQMSKLPGRRLLVVFSPGFSVDFPEIRSAAAVSINRVIQSGVVLNVLNTQGPASTTRNSDSAALEELSSATGGSFFSGFSLSPDFILYPDLLYLIDIPLSAVRADGSIHQLKVEVSSPGSRLRARQSFIAPGPPK